METGARAPSDERRYQMSPSCLVMYVCLYLKVREPSLAFTLWMLVTKCDVSPSRVEIVGNLSTGRWCMIVQKYSQNSSEWYYVQSHEMRQKMCLFSMILLYIFRPQNPTLKNRAHCRWCRTCRRCCVVMSLTRSFTMAKLLKSETRSGSPNQYCGCSFCTPGHVVIW